MKKLRVVLLVLIMAGFSVNTYAVVAKNNGHHKAVGAPLDGGLLSILGASGVSYYLVRKKKKDSTVI